MDDPPGGRASPLLMEPPATFRVLTYNLQKCQSATRHASPNQLIEAICARNAQVIACQEVFHDRDHRLPFSRQLQSALQHEHVFGPNAFYLEGCHGNATFSAYPVDHQCNHDVSCHRLERRGILHTSLKIQNRNLEVFNCHFSLTAGQRRRQWSRLESILDRFGSRPVLICGDFNDWSGSLDRYIKKNNSLTGALWGLSPRARRSFPAKRPLLPLDRIYFRGLRLQEVQVLNQPNWRHLSDHLPLEAEFRFSPEV